MLEIKFVGSKKVVREDTNEEITRNEYDVGGYAVREYIHAYVDGSTFRNFDVYNKTESHKTFAPAIYFQNGFFGEEERFEIQTTSYGSLSMDDFVEFLEAQKRALDVVKALSAAFIK